MYNGNTISLKKILWTVMNNPLTEGLNYEDAAQYAIEGLRLIGAPLTYKDIVTDPPIEVENYKAKLPDNLIYIRGIRIINNLENYEDNPIAMRYATDIYHTGKKCDTENDVPYEYTYSINNGIIYTSIDKGHIQVSYKGLALDEDGYPLIPDNQKAKLALEYYILFRYLEPLWMIGKITDKAFEYVNQKKCFYMGGADTSMKLEGIDHLESTMNTINRLIINSKAHDNFYKGIGEKERLRKYN